MNIRHALPAFGLLISAASLAGCGRGEASTAQSAEAPREISVAVAAVEVADAAARYTGTTHLEAYGEAAVTARVGGEVLEILVEEGERVRAGQVLARLDGERLRLAMERANAELDKLRQGYRRNVALHERGLVSQGAFENLRYDLEALDSAARLARLQYGYTQIRAPIAGVVSGRKITVGTTVREDDVLFRVTGLDDLVAYVHVPQKDLRRFAPGQQASLQMTAWEGESFPATVTRVSPTADPDSGTFRVTLAVPAADGRLRPGMFGKLDIVYEVHEDALLVPSVAVLDEDSEAAVFVVDEGQARRRRVTTGLRTDGRTEVLSGLSAGERIVVVGQSGLREGAPVTIDASAGEI